MPIENLTNVPKSFLKLGQIRKGAPKGENTPGKDLSYFRVTFLKNVTAGMRQVDLGALLQNRFREVYGDKPTFINVRFADHFVNSVWDANFECYKQGGLIAKAGSTSNGAYWIFYRDMETMETLISDGRARTQKGEEMLAQPLDVKKPIYHNAKGEPFFLEPVGRLKVVIPELADLAVGYFEFRPESPRDIRNVSAELGAYDALAKQYGKTIAGIPFKIIRREEIVSKRIKGKLTEGPSWVVHLDVDGEWGSRAIDVIERLALPDIVDGEVTIPQLEQGEPVDYGVNVPEPIDDNDEQDAKVEDVHLLDPHGKEAVDIACQVWNVTDRSKVAQELWKKFPKGAKYMTAQEIKESIS